MQGKKDKIKGNDQAFDGVNEDDAPSVEKSRLKRKIGIGIATGIAVVAAGVGISLLANGKLDFRAALHTSAVKGRGHRRRSGRGYCPGTQSTRRGAYCRRSEGR